VFFLSVSIHMLGEYNKASIIGANYSTVCVRDYPIVWVHGFQIKIRIFSKIIYSKVSLCIFYIQYHIPDELSFTERK
jgi:hypothetical protein